MKSDVSDCLSFKLIISKKGNIENISLFYLKSDKSDESDDLNFK